MPAADEISISINGDRCKVPVGVDLPSLLASLGLPLPGVLIEYNGTALLRTEWPSVRLLDGDRLEILRIVAGG